MQVDQSAPVNERRSIAPTPINVVVLEDHPMVADMLGGLLAMEADIELVGTAHSIGDLVPLLRERIDVAVLDYQLPDGTGAMAARAVKRRWPASHVIMLSGVRDDATMLETIEAGADGYLHKDDAVEADLVTAVRAAHRNEVLLPPQVVYEIARQVEASRRDDERIRLHTLTARELDVLRLLGAGKTLAQICASLGVSRNTARTHIQHVIDKLGAHSKLEAVTVGLRLRLIEAPAVREGATVTR